MSESILSKFDKLAAEIEDVTAVMEKTEEFRAFGRWIQERHVESNVICDINLYQDILSIDVEGTITKADSLLQIRYTDKKAGKKEKK